MKGKIAGERQVRCNTITQENPRKRKWGFRRDTGHDGQMSHIGNPNEEVERWGVSMQQMREG